MKKINHKRMLCICLAIAMMVSMFAVTASAASYSTYVASDTTATAGSPYLYQDTYTVSVTNSGAFNCSLWFKKGSNIIGQKTMYYNTSSDYVKTWKPWVSSAGTYTLYIYNNRNAGQTIYTSVTRGG